MPKTTYLANNLLNHQMGGPDYVRPVTLYLALFTGIPNVNGTGPEITGPGYGRLAVTNNITNFPTASGGLKVNGVLLTMASPTGSWGVATHFGWWDASTGGNLLRFGQLTVAKTIDNGDIVEFQPGELRSTET